MRTSKTYLSIGAVAPIVLTLLNLIVFPFWNAGDGEARVALFIISLLAAPITFVVTHAGRFHDRTPFFVGTGMAIALPVAYLVTHDSSVGETQILLFRSFLAGIVLWSVCWGIIARRAATSRSVAIS